jgi:hypothetical protein
MEHGVEEKDGGVVRERVEAGSDGEDGVVWM